VTHFVIVPISLCILIRSSARSD